MFQTRSDLQLEKDASSRFLPWVIAVMVFLAALALAGGLGLSSAVAGWDRSVEGRLTAQVGDVAGTSAKGTDTREARVAAAVKLLAGTQGVKSARAMSRAEVNALLDPWLGKDNLSADLPIPTLIDVQLATGTSIDAGALAARLAQAVPGTRLDDHKTWLMPLVRLARVLQLLAVAIVLLVGLATVAMVVFATRAGLAVHRDVIEVLHLIGAHDGYIARQFQRHTFRLALLGGIPGVLVAGGAILVLRGLSQGLQAALLPHVAIGPGGWAGLAAVPLIAVVLAVLTARFTVLGTLRRML